MEGSSSSSAALNCKLSYFPIAGRGEPARLAFTLGNIPFDDIRIQGKDWAALKGSTPWGSLPFIELTDGTVLGQSRAVHRFAGRAAGLYPPDQVQAALVDACMDACDDLLVRDSRSCLQLASATPSAARSQRAFHCGCLN
jgi:glutathione S-transferase